MRTNKLNRRDLLTSGAAIMGAAATGVAFEPNAAAAEKKASGAAHKDSAVSSNYNPPIAQVDSGQLRGFRDGKTTIFLGVPYADAERFEVPKAVKPWDG